MCVCFLLSSGSLTSGLVTAGGRRAGEIEARFSQKNWTVFWVFLMCVVLYYLQQVCQEEQFCGYPDKPAGPNSSLYSHQHRSAAESSAIRHKQCISRIYIGSRLAAVTTRFLACDVTVMSHRFPLRVLPQVTIAVTWRGNADVVLMRAVTSQTAVPTGTVVMDRLWRRDTEKMKALVKHWKKDRICWIERYVFVLVRLDTHRHVCGPGLQLSLSIIPLGNKMLQKHQEWISGNSRLARIKNTKKDHFK